MSKLIDLGEIATIIWRRKRIVFITVLVAIVLTALITSQSTPTRRAEATINLGQHRDRLFTVDKLAKEYFLSDLIVMPVAKKLNQSPKMVRETIKVQTLNNEKMLLISARSKDPQLALALVRTTVQEYKTQSDAFLNKELTAYRKYLVTIDERVKAIDVQLKVMENSMINQPDNLAIAINAGGLGQEKSSLLEQRLRIEESINSLNEVRIINTPKIKNPGIIQLWAVNLMAALLLGTALGVLLALRREVNDKRQVSHGDS